MNHELPHLRGPVPLSHLVLHAFVRPGDAVADATCGNGSDTLLLAELVGSSGHVWAFDIQPDAITRTGNRVAESGQVTLVEAGHETIGMHITVPLSAIVFNLGYLPGGDRSIVTMPQTTVKALEQALSLLAPGGIAAVTVYPGHDGGESESIMLDAWAAALSRDFHSWRMGQLNVTADAPYLIVIQKSCR